MRILSISYLDIWPGGEGKGIPSMFISQKALVDRGHEVHFICPVRKEETGYVNYQGIHIYRMKLPFNITAVLSAKPIRLDKLLSHIKALILYNLAWFFFQLWSLIWAIKIARRIKPQIIYSHDLTPAFSAWLVSKIFSAKFILRIYGTRNLYWRYKNKWTRLKEIRDYTALKFPADYFIITKDGTKADLLAKELGVPEKKIRHWRNGVDFDLYDPTTEARKRIRQKLGLEENTKIIISTSRLIPFYNLDRLIYKLPKLYQLNPHCVCIIASYGPEKEKFEEFVREKNIQNRTFFVGYVDRSYLKDLLNASDLFVSLSSYSNCNNALFEAMVTGKVVVTLENNNIKELIEPGENGYLLKENELEQLPEILNQILTNEEMTKKFQTNIRITARQKLWTWEERMKEEIKLLESLV